MIEIGRFQPGNVGCDLKQVFKDRQCAANQSRSQNSVTDRERTLESNHAPIKPNVSDSNQIASPTQKPARTNWPRRRTCNVRETAVKPLIRLVTSNGASIGPNRMLLHRLT